MPDDRVRLIVEGQEFIGWTGVEIKQSFSQGADAFSMSAPLDPNDPAVRKAFRPFGYQEVELYVGQDKMLTGRIDRTAPTVSGRERVISVQGRSRAGVIVDSSIDGNWEWNQKFLADIAIELCRPFAVVVRWDNNTNPIDARATYGQGVYAFLISLAAPHNLLLHSSPAGQLVITWATWFRDNPPVAALVEGEGPLPRIEASFDGTGRFSTHKIAGQFAGTPDIVGEAVDTGVPIYRPKLATESEVDADPQFTAARKRTESVAQSFGVSATVSGWRTPDGQVWGKHEASGRIIMPNVTLKAPGVMLSTEALYTVVGSVLRLDDEDGQVADLQLAQPEYYAGQIPEVTPWD